MFIFAVVLDAISKSVEQVISHTLLNALKLLCTENMRKVSAYCHFMVDNSLHFFLCLRPQFVPRFVWRLTSNSQLCCSYLLPDIPTGVACRGGYNKICMYRPISFFFTFNGSLWLLSVLSRVSNYVQHVGSYGQIWTMGLNLSFLNAMMSCSCVVSRTVSVGHEKTN